MTRLVVVSAGLSTPSSTRNLADQLASAAVLALEDERGGVDVHVVELRTLARAITDSMLTGFAAGDLPAVQDALTTADGLVVVSPTFSASYSGLFKSFFDVLETGVLEGMPVLMGATAGTARHSLVLEHALRPLFSYLKAVPVPTAVFAATEDFGSVALAARITRAAEELAAAVRGGRRPGVVDPFDGVTPFAEQLLSVSGAHE